MKLLSRLSTQSPHVEERMSWEEYLGWVNSVYGGKPMTSYGSLGEAIANDFGSNVGSAMKRNGPIFSLIAFRVALFSQARWVYQEFNKGRPGDLFSTPTLDLLNDDANLNKWMVLDNDLAGNFYGVLESGSVRNEPRITRMRPDWVQVVSDLPLDNIRARKRGYAYFEGGFHGQPIDEAEMFDVGQVVHWYDQIDPEAKWRGMSWISPIAREVAADNASTSHKLKFFDNGATPNLVFRFDEKTSPAAVREFRDMIKTEHTGVQNAYKNLYLGGGADVTVIGSDLKQLEFSATQGKGESRLASAARVPAVLVGFSEGLQAATYSNFSQARRAAADGLLHPLWVSAAGALGEVVEPPTGSRLWYDARDIPFLREDAMDDAEIKAREAQTIRTLVDAGYRPDSVVAAVTSGDWARLEHTDLFSVQLQPPGTQQTPARSVHVETDERGWPLRLVEER